MYDSKGPIEIVGEQYKDQKTKPVNKQGEI